MSPFTVNFLCYLLLNWCFPNVCKCVKELKESEDEKEIHVGSSDEQKNNGQSPPQSADEESDIESLRSFHYSPKAVDLPSAVRLAKRLYSLDGFKKSDVSRHLSKKYNIQFNQSLIYLVDKFV